MSNVKSTDIRVFPTGNRTNDVTAGETTEKNLTQITKSLYKRESFVVRFNSTAPVVLSFVLGGYYFEVNNLADLPSTTNLWAYIFVSNDSSTYDKLRDVNGTINLDSEGNFNGVYFYSTKQSNLRAEGCTTYELEILRNSVIPLTSKIYYNSNEILNTESSPTAISYLFNTTYLNAGYLTLSNPLNGDKVINADNLNVGIPTSFTTSYTASTQTLNITFTTRQNN